MKKKLSWAVGLALFSVQFIYSVDAFAVRCAEVIEMPYENKVDVSLGALQVLDHYIKGNSFTTNRGMKSSNASYSYSAALGKGFMTSLKGLSKSQHWLDAGAGQGIALADYIRQGGKALTTGVVYTGSNERLVLAEGYQAQRNRWLEGRYIEHISNEEIGRVDLITDFLGPLSYSVEVDLVLQKYLDLMKRGAALYVKFTLRDTFEVHGKKESFLEWLQVIPGLKVSKEVEGAETLAVKITKTQAQVVVPALKLVALDPLARPPERSFEPYSED